jgi:hypothetical protein
MTKSKWFLLDMMLPAAVAPQLLASNAGPGIQLAKPRPNSGTAKPATFPAPRSIPTRTAPAGAPPQLVGCTGLPRWRAVLIPGCRRKYSLTVASRGGHLQPLPDLSESFTDDLDQHPFAASAIEFAIKDLLPRAQVQCPASDCHHHLTPHDLTFQVGIAVIFTGAVVLVL